jgi:hypothetical protein
MSAPVPGTFQNKGRKNFTMLANAMLRNPGMSLKAKGLLGVMLSFPDDWKYYLTHIETQSSDGKDSHRAALKELMDFGYVIRRPLRTEKGRLAGYEYEVSDEGWEAPVNVKSSTNGFPGAGETGAGLSGAGEPAPTKNDFTNTELTKNDPKEGGKSGGKPFQLPDWIPDELWADFLGHRIALKKPLSPVAAGRLIAELTRLKGEGQDPARVLDQSILSGWAGVFPIKAQQYAPQGTTRGAEANNNPFQVPVHLPEEDVNW